MHSVLLFNLFNDSPYVVDLDGGNLHFYCTSYFYLMTGDESKLLVYMFILQLDFCKRAKPHYNYDMRLPAELVQFTIRNELVQGSLSVHFFLKDLIDLTFEL